MGDRTLTKTQLDQIKAMLKEIYLETKDPGFSTEPCGCIHCDCELNLDFCKIECNIKEILLILNGQK